MAITTLAQVKLILSITDSSKDALITALIPLVESEYLSIRNKPFDTVASGELMGYGDDTETEFTLKYHPIISGSLTVYINGTLTTAYTANIVSGIITFTTAPAVGEKITADYTAVYFIYPEGSELTAIQMIGYRLQADVTGKEIKSESLGDHSVTYENSAKGEVGAGGYPASITAGIRKYTNFV